jgi:hypothetical protein
MENIKKVPVLAYLTPIGFIVAFYINYNNKTKSGAFHLRQALGLHCYSFLMYLIPYVLIGGVGFDLLGIFTYLMATILLVFSLGYISIYLIKIYAKAIKSANKGEMNSLPVLGDLCEKWFSFIR